MGMTFGSGIRITGGVSVTSPAANDPYFMYNTLLLPGNGTNGAQNNTFTDGSTNNFTVTRYGNTTQGTFSPYGGNWSNYFGGSGDYLNTPSNAAFGFGTGDFTIEGWFYFTGTIGTYQRPWWFGDDNDNIEINGSVLKVGGASQGTLITGGTTIIANTWYHIALTRASGSYKLWLNGTQQGSTATNSYNSSARTFTAMATSSGVQPSTGYVSNLRIVKGTALYNATFTPSTTPLTAIANTSLLTCQSNRFIDTSTNAFAITVNGNTNIQRFSPFSPTAAYSAGTIGGSGYFDGTGDYLSTSANAAFTFGTNDHTIEFYYYLPSTSLAGGYATQWKYSSGSTQQATNDYFFQIGTATGSNIALLLGGGGSWGVLIQPSVSINAFVGVWTHIAWTRSGNTFRLFFNGVQVGTATYAGSITAQSGPMLLGQGGASEWAGGYYSDFRVNNGTAVYTSNFTPPSAPLTAITNTSLLLNYTNTGIIDNTMLNDLETVGNAQISTTQSKFGGSSMYFDGTGDWLVTPSSLAMALGSTFTVECWIYVIGWGGGSPLILDVRDSNIVGAIYLVSDGTARMQTTGTGTIASQSGITLNTWIHVAFVSDATSSRIYVNGSNTGATNQGQALFPTTAKAGFIGADFTGSSNFNGYIDDFRITKGYARYTANFTPPTTAFPLC